MRQRLIIIKGVIRVLIWRKQKKTYLMFLPDSVYDDVRYLGENLIEYVDTDRVFAQHLILLLFRTIRFTHNDVFTVR
jgi:hypothetical protein